MIKETARETIIALGLVPEENVMIDVLDPDWNGTPEIRITSEPTKAEDETQAGAITAETLMGIHSIAGSRQEAWDLMRQAALVVYKKFEALEQQRGSGILAITLVEHNTSQLPNNSTFHSYTIFRILTTNL